MHTLKGLVWLKKALFSMRGQQCVDNISLLYHLPACRFFALLAVQNVLWQGTCLFGELPRNISWRGRTGSVSACAQMIGPPGGGHRPGPLGVCNPNEKTKPPPLRVGIMGVHSSLYRIKREGDQAFYDDDPKCSYLHT